MHDFPPTTFSNPGSMWSFGPGASILLILLILYAGLATYRFRSSSACVAWSAATAFAVILCLSTCGAVQEPNGPGLWSIGFSILIVITSLIALTRTLRATNRLEGTATASIGMIGGFVMLVLAVLCTPRFQGVREAARRTQCRNNLKQLSLAMHNYHDVYESFPAAVIGQPEASWRSRLMPYIDGNSFSERYHWDVAWDADLNRPFQFEVVSIYNCPSRPQNTDDQGRFLTAYVCPIGADTMFANNSGYKLNNITDGTSNTLMMLEACGTDIIWTEPRDVEVSDVTMGVNLPGDAPSQSDGVLSSYHIMGAQAALADGSVRFVGERIDPQILNALLTPAGGEKTGEW